jgi:hypothetical protein
MINCIAAVAVASVAALTAAGAGAARTAATAPCGCMCAGKVPEDNFVIKKETVSSNG